MKLRCFARCERRGECRGAVKGSIALQSRLTMIDRSREPCLNALPLMLQHACGERSDRVQGHSALARCHGARSPLAESEAAPQVDPGEAPAQKSATKLRCFARCERRGERRGAVKGSIALQSRLTRIDRSREHC